MSVEQVSLYKQEGSSDKVYHLQLVETPEGFVVNYQNGRRGGTLQSGCKTPAPVELAAAQKIFNKVKKEKLGGGYTEGESGTAYQGTADEARVTGVLPQLLNPLDEADVERYLADPAWAAQEKMDGDRRLAQVIDGEAQGINRKGLALAMPLPIAGGIATLSNGTVVDGEQIGDVLHLFDVLQIGSRDVRGLAMKARHDLLLELAEDCAGQGKAVRVVPTVYTEADKRALFNRVKQAGGEGVVFKRIAAPYTVGRPNSGGDQMKFKFLASATLRVAKVNKGKRSVAVEGFDAAGRVVALGNVTIAANRDIPVPGSLVEVVYLYAYRGGSLYQPVYRGVRTDLDVTACTTAQLKYKSETTTEDDEG